MYTNALTWPLFKLLTTKLMLWITVQIHNPKNNEIKKIVNFQFITTSESYWYISGNDVHGREPSIQRLAVHEENMQTVYFQENDVAEAITNPNNTTLLAWFKLNLVDADAWMLKYHEIPEHVWHQAQHCWRKGK